MAEFDLDELAAAPVVLVLHNDGRAELTVADAVNDSELATYIRTLADYIEAGKHREGCDQCTSGAPHEHGDTDPVPE